MDLEHVSDDLLVGLTLFGESGGAAKSIARCRCRCRKGGVLRRLSESVGQSRTPQAPRSSENVSDDLWTVGGRLPPVH
ncbi:MAG: hypothetical protein E7J15_08395 [Neisseria sp.]|nr:hypothetical protein [Neisseria sp.]